MWHNGGFGCKGWVWDKIFWTPRMHYGQLIKINVPEQDIPNMGEQRANGTWDWYGALGSWE